MEISRKRWRIHRQSPQYQPPKLLQNYRVIWWELGIQFNRHWLYPLWSFKILIVSLPTFPFKKKLRNLVISPYLPIYMPYMKGFYIPISSVPSPQLEKLQSQGAILQCHHHSTPLQEFWSRLVASFPTFQRYAGAKVAKVLESKSGDGNLLLLPQKNTRRFFLIAFLRRDKK